MLLSEMIEKLQAIYEEKGELPVAMPVEPDLVTCRDGDYFVSGNGLTFCSGNSEMNIPPFVLIEAGAYQTFEAHKLKGVG